MSKISIVVPIYNVEKFLPQCIESLCGQTYKDIEIILVNDGSTDGSAEIVEEYAKKDSRIKYINQENQGANVARNAGLDITTGEWICFLDGDDWVDENMCAEIQQYLSADLDILFYTYRLVYPTYVKEAINIGNDFEIQREEFVELQYATLNRLGPYRFGVHTMDTVSVWDKVYRVDFLRENGLKFIDELPKLQDLTFNLNVYDYAQKGYALNKAYYNYRIHDGSVTKRYQEDIVGKFQVIHKHLLLFMERHAGDAVMKQAFYERVATHMRTCMVLNFCNENNYKPYSVRKKEFLIACEDRVFAEALKKVNLKNFSIKEQILSICIKNKWFLACNVLYKLNRISEKIRVKNKSW